MRPLGHAFPSGYVKPSVGQGVVCSVVFCPHLKKLTGVALVGDLQAERHQVLTGLRKPNLTVVSYLNALLDYRLVVCDGIGGSGARAALVLIAHEHAVRVLDRSPSIDANKRVYVV